MRHIVVFIPGIMGSELWLEDKMIWPGSLSRLVFGYPYMDELMRDDLAVGDVIRNVSFSTQYGALVELLAAWGFDEKGPTPNLVLCPYDWRRDNAIAAELLATHIERVASQADVEISLIGHSMGGLVARHYLESGRFDDRAGFGAVKRLITLGTPHRGSPVALTAAVGLERRLWLSEQQVARLVNDPRYPSLYQLIPPRDEPCVWDRHDTHATLDPFSLGPTLALSAANLASALAFHASLTGPRAGVRYFCFVGTRQTTPTLTLIGRAGGAYTIAANLEAPDAGDGTVPEWSARLAGVQSLPVGGEHSKLYKNDELQRTLGTILGVISPVLAARGRVEIAVRDRVVEPGADVHVCLDIGRGIFELDGMLIVERVELAADGTIVSEKTVDQVPITYSGGELETLAIVLAAPRERGSYRLTLKGAKVPLPLPTDELFVQDP